LSWLIAGLGNPGPQYEKTRHNLGFMLVDVLANRLQTRISRDECRALIGRGIIDSQTVELAKPQTFMNLSGVAVKGLLEKYELKTSDLLLVYDELALPWMQLRIRPRGSSAGHNGVKSVIASLATEEFARLRIGVSPGEDRAGGQKYLLSSIRRGLEKQLDELLDNASNAVESVTAEGVDKSMAIYNRSARGEKEEA
jgi:PTH1 family peptidyl-tRNA hydrolase